MIIECGSCRSKFNLDEGLLQAGGSKVRCSVCRNVFIAYPPEEVPIEEPATDMILQEGLDETLSLDSAPDARREETEVLEQAGESGFDLAFEEAVEEADVREAVSPDEIPDIEAETADNIARKEAVEGLEAEGAPEPAATSVAKPKTRRSRALVIILLIILLILGGAVVASRFAKGIIPDSIPFLQPSKKQEAMDPGVARLSFKAVSGSFIQSHKAGQLFLIKGMVTNNYPKPRSFILVKGTILNDKGKVVKINMAYAGNTFAEKQIKEKPIEELNNGLKIRMGRNRMNLNLQPGATIPFMIILDKLPVNVSEFTVEAVSSSPGK
jgi:predicted Zn finger-like uncharacterized protein